MPQEIDYQAIVREERRPRHCGQDMDPSAGAGIWECRKCDGYVVLATYEEFRRVSGMDLERTNVSINR